MESPDKQWSLMQLLVPLLPNHVHYVSVFGGEGADILCKPPSELETFNDMNHNIYDFFSVLINESACHELGERLQPTGIANIRLKNDRVASVVAFLQAVRRGLSAAGIRQPKNLLDLLESVRRRFLGVQIEDNSPYRLIENLDSPKTLFLVNPPDAMPLGQRQAMLDLLNRIGGKAVLIGQNNPDSNNGLAQWRRQKLNGVTVWFK